MFGVESISTPKEEILLDVQNLTTSFRTDDGRITAVNGVSFQVKRGKTLCVVGESGCGKSVTANSIMRLIPTSNGSIDCGSVKLDGKDLLQLSPEDMRRTRGNEIAMIFQEPMTALNPVYTVGEQVAEVFWTHQGLSRSESMKRSVGMLEKVRIPDPHLRVNEYPHQLSGGMKQRVVIAMALACKPQLLIADEPTTALDVTVQAQVLTLMRDMQKDTGASILFITHDLGVVAEMADDVIVMYAGQIIERSNVFEIYENPQHPYTKGLLKSIPTMESSRETELYTIKGMVPSLAKLPVGCRFQDRCPLKQQKCMDSNPELKAVQAGHEVACFFTGEQCT